MASFYAYVTEFSGELLLVFGAVFLTAYYLCQRYSVSDSGRKLPPAMPSLPIRAGLRHYASYATA